MYQLQISARQLEVILESCHLYTVLIEGQLPEVADLFVGRVSPARLATIRSRLEKISAGIRFSTREDPKPPDSYLIAVDIYKAIGAKLETERGLPTMMPPSVSEEPIVNIIKLQPAQATQAPQSLYNNLIK